MLNNYLIYFYQPSKASGIPDLIPQGRLVLGVLTIIGMIKAVGHIIDAVTDPLIAAGSDKSRHKDGRRIPLMKKAAIPFGLCALLIFFVPLNRVSGLNAAWIAAFMWGYYFAVLNVLPGAMMAVHEKGRCTARLIAKNLPGHAGLGGDTRPPSCVWRPLSRRRTRRSCISGGSTRRHVGCSRPWRPT